MTGTRKQLGVGAAVMLPLAAVGAWSLGWCGGSPASPVGAMQKPAEPAAVAAPALAVAPTTGAAPAGQPGSNESMLAMPDGSLVAPLNGVVKPAAISWGDFPWSKIVRIQHDPGCDWYVHEDGTYTTTLMKWRSDLKREDPVTICLHPTRMAPVDTGGELPVGEAGSAKKD